MRALGCGVEELVAQLGAENAIKRVETELRRAKRARSRKLHAFWSDVLVRIETETDEQRNRKPPRGARRIASSGNDAGPEGQYARRATGNEAGNYLLAGPGWKGEKPDGVKAVIRSETDVAFVLYRTQLFSPDDIDEREAGSGRLHGSAALAFLGEPPQSLTAAIDWMKPLSAEQERTSPASSSAN